MKIPFIYTFTIMETIPHNSSQSSYYYNPLLSSIITFYILILIYLPQFFLRVFFSPLLISTLILLLSLLRLGVSQQQQRQQQQQSDISHGGGASAPPRCLTQNDPDPIENQHSKEYGLEAKPEIEPNSVVTHQRQEVKVEEDVARLPCNNTLEAHAQVEPGPEHEPEDKSSVDINCEGNQCLDWPEPKPAFSPKLLVEWDVGAPLEVIYEAYEGEEEEGEDGEDEGKNDSFWRNNNEGCYSDHGVVLDKYPSLSRFYPESDSDSDSDSESVLSTSWDGEYEDKEGLIEITLDYEFDNKKVHNNFTSKVVDEKEVFCFDDEDNLIEIDIFPH